jgi:cysteine desulfurase family protein
MIYLDNAATSFPKAPDVAEAVRRHLAEMPGNANRASHDGAVGASRLLFRTRERLARLVGAPDSRRVVFTSSATAALNTVFQGLLAPGERVLVSSCEHNSVMRPLTWLAKERGIVIDRFQLGSDGTADLDDYHALLAARPRLVAITAVSNVTGAVFPWRAMARAAREAGALFLLDAAQAIGTMPLDDAASIVDFLAASGHKGLLGPTGTGFLFARAGIPLRPLLFGGTGSRSSEETQPEEWPDAMESGTRNLAGIAGLDAALEFIEATGVAVIDTRINGLTRFTRARLERIDGLRLHGPADAHGIISFTAANREVSEIVTALDAAGIAVRGGLHCAPGAHRAIGTFPAGTVRLGIGFFNTEAEIEAAARIVEEES